MLHRLLAYAFSSYLDIVETSAIILSEKRTTYAMFKGLGVQADLYYNFLLKKVFSFRGLFRSVVNPLLHSFLNIVGANRIGGRND